MTRAPASLVLLAAFGLATPGCGGRHEPSALTFQTIAAPGTDEYHLAEALAAEFNRANPDLRVTLRGPRLGYEYLVRSLIAREAGDVIEVRPEEAVAAPLREALADLTADCSGLASQCQPDAWSLGFFERRLLAVAWAARPELLLCNKAAFRAAGLSPDRPPRSWDDWLDAARKLTLPPDAARTRVPFGFALAARRSTDLGRLFVTLLAEHGVTLIGLEWDTPTFHINLVAGRRAARLLLDLERCAPPECVLSDGRAALKQFWAGRAAMAIAGPAGLSPEAGGLSAGDIVVAPIPAPDDGESRSYVEFRHLCIPESLPPARRAAAIRFVRFLVSRPAQDLVARGVNGCTPLVPVRTESLDRASPALRAFAAAVPRAATPPPHYAWEGKCAKDWIGGIRTLLLDDPRPLNEVTLLAQIQGNQALACLHTQIGHPSATMMLGMLFVAALIFVAVAYGVSRR